MAEDAKYNLAASTARQSRTTRSNAFEGEMLLGLVLTQRCNAVCLHCSTSCGPHKDATLSSESARYLISRAADLSDGEVLQVCLTGGEPFLHYQELRRIVEHAASVRSLVTCVTNGFWALSETRALARLEPLRTAGLAVIGFSTSEFHQRFIPVSRIANGVRAAKRLGLKVVVKFPYTTSGLQESGLRAQLGEELEGVTLEAFPLLPTIREGKTLHDSEFPRTQGIPVGRCPLPVITVRETGTAYMCCVPGGFVDRLALGDALEDDFGDIENRFWFGSVPRILREHGPSYFVDEVIRRGHGRLLRQSYAGVCDLCTQLMGVAELGGVVDDVAGEFEMETIKTLLGCLAAAD